MGGANLHPTDEVKKFGINLDSRLTFTAHALAVQSDSTSRHHCPEHV